MQPDVLNASHCRRRALEAERLARSAPTPLDAEELASIAFLWRSMEQRAHRRDEAAAASDPAGEKIVYLDAHRRAAD